MSATGSQGATPYEVTADGVVYAGPCRVTGATLDHTASTSAILYDNASAASGTKITTLRCGANASDNHFWGDEGVECKNGVYADWTAGTIMVYIKH